MMSLVIINESVNDRTICPAIQGFVRSIPNSDRTLSVDRPLFAALHVSNQSMLVFCFRGHVRGLHVFTNYKSPQQ